jgi:hypothetical protein
MKTPQYATDSRCSIIGSGLLFLLFLWLLLLLLVCLVRLLNCLLFSFRGEMLSHKPNDGVAFLPKESIGKQIIYSG